MSNDSTFYNSESDLIYHPDICHSRAGKHRKKVLQTFSTERWLDMGMSMVTFTVHTDEQGRLVADV